MGQASDEKDRACGSRFASNEDARTEQPSSARTGADVPHGRDAAPMHERDDDLLRLLGGTGC